MSIIFFAIFINREWTSKGIKFATNRLQKMNHYAEWWGRGKYKQADKFEFCFSPLPHHSEQWFIFCRRFIANFISASPLPIYQGLYFNSLLY